MNNVQISSDDVLQYANQLSMMEQEILQIFQEIKRFGHRPPQRI